MVTTNKIMVGIDDQIIELTGKEKQDFIKDREETNARIVLLEAEYKKKEEARKSALEKLAEIAGLTKDEMAALGL